MNTYYYETASGYKGRFKAETDYKAKQRKFFDGVKIWREEERPHRLTLVLDRKRN